MLISDCSSAMAREDAGRSRWHEGGRAVISTRANLPGRTALR